MATKEVKQLVLERVPPGDQWTDPEVDSGVFPSLTDGLEYAFQKSGGKSTEFHLSSFKGEIYSVVQEEEPDAPPLNELKWNSVDLPPDFWNAYSNPSVSDGNTPESTSGSVH
jgi:hypothetical protein